MAQEASEQSALAFARDEIDIADELGAAGRIHGKPVRSIRIDKLIIDPNAAVVGQQQHDQAGRSDRAAIVRDHAPVELDHIAQLFDAAGEFEPVMPLGDIGLMRRRDPYFELGVAVHLTGPDIVRAVLDPESGDLGAAAGSVSFQTWI